MSDPTLQTVADNQPATMAHSEATASAHVKEVSAPAAVLDDEAHLEKAPKANVTPERVSELPTTTDDAPATAPGNPDNLDPETEDLGWSQDPKRPLPVLQGLKNESLWLLVRRFNKQTYRVRAIENHPEEGLDFLISNKEEFSPDKLKATIERLYVTVVIGMATFAKHVARIRSWTEPRRTAGFAIVYFAAWMLNLIMPTFFVLLMVLILSPRARKVLFPPAPLAAIDAKTGQAKVPKAGHLGSKSNLTGAAETYEGEAAEQEASNFVEALGSVAVSTAAGKSITISKSAADDDDDDEGEKALKQPSDAEEKVPDPTNISKISHEAQSKAAGDKTGHPEKGDATKKPMEEAMLASLSPFMHMLNNVVDDWERLGNALSPTPPFSRWTPRYRLAGVLLPVLLASFFITENMIYKSSTFGFGFGMFGQPIIDRVKFPAIIAWLDKNIPDWKKYLELRFMLLRGVPTNAQLTATLLRIGEANKAPLPPPPTVNAPPPDALHGSDMANHPDLPPEYSEQLAEAHIFAPGDEEETIPTEPKKKSNKILSILKTTTKAGVESALGINTVKATLGSLQAKSKIGVVTTEKQAERAANDGPVAFRCRYKGKKGHIFISTTATSPCIGFEKEGSGGVANVSKAAAAVAASEKPVENAQKLVGRNPASFSIAIDDIKEIRKVGGLGWKGKLIVGWALGSEVADGLELFDSQGIVHKVTAIGRRDEVFNRLIALGLQKWEVF